MADSAGPDPLSPAERRAVLREHLEREKDQRRIAEARLAAVLDLHKTGGEYCQEDGFRWPCQTYRAVSEATG